MSAAKQLKDATRKAENEKHQKKFVRDLRALKITGFVEEHLFFPGRKWRFDIAFIDQSIAVELDGGIWGAKSGHNSGIGIISKNEKMNAAQALRWRVFTFDGGQVQSGKAAIFIEKILKEAA